MITGLHSSIPPEDIGYQYFGDICNSPELIIFFNVLASPPFPFIWDSDRASLTYRGSEASVFMAFEKSFPSPSQGNIKIIAQREIGGYCPSIPNGVSAITLSALSYSTTILWLQDVYTNLTSIMTFWAPFPAWSDLNIVSRAAQVPVDLSLVYPPPVDNPQYAPMT
jgi:hypothetical protein